MQALGTTDLTSREPVAPSCPPTLAGSTSNHPAVRPGPLTQRVLERLPGPMWVWRTAWALLPVLQVVVLVPLYDRAGYNPYGRLMFLAGIVGNLTFAYAILHAMWGAAKVAREAGALGPRLASLGATVTEDAETFRHLNSGRAPLVMALVLTVLFGTDTAVLTDWRIALAKAPFDFLVYLPLSVWVWSYLMLMVGLHRLGKRSLRLEAYSGDRSLGLRPVGRLAATGFWIFVANITPILLTNIPYGFGLVVGVAFFAAGIAAFFASLYSLHRQMQGVRQQQLARVRDLYAQAYEPIRFQPDLVTLQAQAPLLSAAEALERRAEAIQTWPFSNLIFTRIVVLASGVLTSVIVKLVLRSIGL